MIKPTKKSEQVAEIILERMRYGEYHNGVLPSLRNLASELGINYLTVRQGLHLLCDRGILGTTRNRKFSILTPPPKSDRLRVALLEGAGSGSRMLRYLSMLLLPRGASLRRYVFSYFNDELLTTVPDMNYDLVFYHIEPEPLPPMVLSKFIACREKMISISFDYSKYGIRSIVEPSVVDSVTILFKLLEERGHNRYDILTPTEAGCIVDQRVDAFRAAAEKAGRICNMHSYKMPPFLFNANVAREAAIAVFSDRHRPDGVFVPAMAHAVGVMRGLFDIGCLAGRDYSLVSCGDIEMAQNSIPSITATTSEDFTGVIGEIIDGKDKEKLVYPLNDPELFIGESLRETN